MPAITEKSAESTLAPESEAEAFTEAEPEAIEREHFEMLERETTQPVRRYFEPRHAHHIGYTDVAHAVDFEVPTEPVPETPPQPEPPIEQFPASETNAALDPWPDPLRMTQPASTEPAHVESFAEEPIAPLAANTAFNEAEPPSASTHAFEPLPFAVPPPGVYRSPAPPTPARYVSDPNILQILIKRAELSPSAFNSEETINFVFSPKNFIIALMKYIFISDNLCQWQA